MSARVDEDRWLSSRFAPLPERHWLVALYAFEFELARVKHVVSEETLGLIRFQWWRESIEGIENWLTGGPEPRRHDVTSALAEVVATSRLTTDFLHRAIDAHESAFIDDGGTAGESRAVCEGAITMLVGEESTDGQQIQWILDVLFDGRDHSPIDEALGPVSESTLPALAHWRFRRRQISNPLSKRLGVLAAVLTKNL